MANHRKSNSTSHPLHNETAAIEQSLGPIEQRPTASLKAYVSNPRRHPERQIVQLMASIGEFGFTMPALVDVDGVLIAGEARVEAARRLGIAHIPVLVAEHWSRAQVRAYRLADDRLAEHATWDLDLLRIEIASVVELGEVEVDVLGWATAEVDVILDGTAAASPDPVDEVPEVPANPVTRSGDLWLLGPHRLLCGSSLDASSWQTLLAGRVAAMAFTDAPYNVPVQGHVSGLGRARHAEFAMASGEMSDAEFVRFNVAYLSHLAAASLDGAIVMACMDWRHLSEILAAAREVGLALINLCVWRKSNAGMGSLYRSQHELVLILKKGRAPHVNNVELGRHGRYRTNVWDYAGANAFGTGRDADLADHPTVKPTALVADAIRDVTRHGDIVLDAFMGSGTTMLAAERTGRIACGIEIAPGYVDVAIRRWSTKTGGGAILDATGETFAVVAARRDAEKAA